MLEIKMDPTIKKKWVDALKSGEYKQGQKCLRPSEDQYCCLGVLTDLYIKETGNANWSWDEFKKGYWFRKEPVSYGGGISFDLLPPDVVDWAKLANYNPIAKGQSLTALNDDGTSFGMIADIIDQYL